MAKPTEQKMRSSIQEILDKLSEKLSSIKNISVSVEENSDEFFLGEGPVEFENAHMTSVISMTIEHPGSEKFPIMFDIILTVDGEENGKAVIQQIDGPFMDEVSGTSLNSIVSKAVDGFYNALRTRYGSEWKKSDSKVEEKENA